MKKRHNGSSFYDLSNKHLGSCIIGRTSVDIVKDVAEDLVLDNGLLDAYQFAENFADALVGIQDDDEVDPECYDVYDTHRYLGYEIASCINDILLELDDSSVA